MRQPGRRGWPATVASHVLARLIAWPVLVLALRRLPTRAEGRRFRQAFCEPTDRMPALLRALATSSAVRDHFDDLLHPTLRALPPVAFMHIEKAAGSSVVNYLTTQFAPDAVDPDPFHGAPGHLLCPLPADKRRYALVWGHADLPSWRRCEPPRRFVLTFLREPRARIVSLYRYWRALHPDEVALGEQHAGVVAARTRSFPDFLQSPEPEVVDFIDNVAARRLTGTYASLLHVGDDAAFEADALAALAGLDFVGIAERMGESLHRLAAALGAEPPRIVPRRNVLALSQMEARSVFLDAPRPTVGRVEAARLDHLTRIDRALYAAAWARHRLPPPGLSAYVSPGDGGGK